MRDSSSRLLQCLRGSHDLIRPCRATNLSAGRQATWLTESNSIPRTTNTVAGPSHFPGWRGKPSRLQTASAVLSLCVHCMESVGPAVIKSSK